jgi:hypothetical protein
MENFSFTLTEAEANIIIAALVKQPFEVVANLIQKLQTQASNQQKSKEIMNAAATVANYQQKEMDNG